MHVPAMVHLLLRKPSLTVFHYELLLNIDSGSQESMNKMSEYIGLHYAADCTHFQRAWVAIRKCRKSHEDKNIIFL